MGKKIRVGVVDDHPLFREGVAAIIDRHNALELVATGGSRADAVAISLEGELDVLLLDIDLPGGGIQAAGEIYAARPNTRIIMLTASENIDHVTNALGSGACCYVLKGVGGDELVRTIIAACAGESYVTPSLAARLLSGRSLQAAAPKPQADISSLTRREEEILDRVAEGDTNKEIAQHFQLSEKTVKHYMTNIMSKLQVRNRVEAALAARGRTQS